MNNIYYKTLPTNGKYEFNLLCKQTLRLLSVPQNVHVLVCM